MARFSDLECYKGRVDDLIECTKALPRADGIDEVLVPGEPEDKVHAARIRDGIPLPEGTVRNLRKVAERFGVELPAPLAEEPPPNP